jgi:hypothetical protein
VTSTPGSLAGENIGRTINPVPLPETRLSYPRRQEYRRLSRAGGAMLASIATGSMGLIAARMGALSLAALLFLGAVAFGLQARHWLLLAAAAVLARARRTRPGARWRLFEARAGAYATRCRGWGGEISTLWRSRQAASRW